MSGIWRHDPELFEKVTLDALPDEWKERLGSGEIGLQDVPDDIMHKASIKGTEDHLAGLTSHTYEYVKSRLHARSSAEKEH